MNWKFFVAQCTCVHVHVVIVVAIASMMIDEIHLMKCVIEAYGHFLELVGKVKVLKCEGHAWVNKDNSLV